MSKKKEFEAYKQGMADGAAPFEEKFEEQAGHLKRVEQNIRHGMNCIDEAMDEVIDVCEEHDERINQIEHGDCERVKALSEEAKEILAGLVVMLFNKFSYNVHQVSFMNTLFAMLELDYDKVLSKEISCMEEIADINAHKVIYQVLCEIMFLVNENTEYSDDFNDMCNNYFAITPRAKEAILLEIEKTYNTLGKKKYIDKYRQTIVEKKAKKVYPKLEMDMYIPFYKDEIYAHELGYDIDLYCDLTDKVYRRESECKEAYARLLDEPIRRRDSYIDANSKNFVGNELVKHYGQSVEKFISAIYDYVNIHKVRMDISELLELRDNCRQEIINCTEAAVLARNNTNPMDSKSHYKEFMIFEEDTTYVSTLFSDFKEVTCYILSDKCDVYEYTEQMALELNTFLTYIYIEVDDMVRNKYLSRIKNCINQINQLLGNA